AHTGGKGRHLKLALVRRIRAGHERSLSRLRSSWSEPRVVYAITLAAGNSIGKPVSSPPCNKLICKEVLIFSLQPSLQPNDSTITHGNNVLHKNCESCNN